MDQNSSNGAGTEKKNWRERLGIGGRELPKLSAEFRPTAAPATAVPSSPPPPAGTARPAPRMPQPVTRPAPMAPRPATSATRSAGAPPAAPQGAASVAPRLSEGWPGETTVKDALAEKLRAQRAAAEKLAEQRVQAARDRAEGRTWAGEPGLGQTPRPAAPANGTASQTGRPKFSFAEDEMGRTQPSAPQPPGPARPAAGGERTQPPFLRPAPAATRPQPGYRADGQPAYRPIDPATGYTPPPRYQPAPGRSGYGAELPPGYGPTPSARRPATTEAYPRSYGPAGDPYADEQRTPPRLTRAAPARGRPRVAEDELDDVFEEEPAPRRRASARDYQSAYYDTAGGMEDEQRRSSGPWLLLLALLLAALVTGGVVWFYNTKIRTAPTAGVSGQDAPLVTAPEQPAKVEPERPADGQATAPAVQKKQIYDRIVGDQEVLGGELAPTEEIPVAPADAQPASPPSPAPAPAAPQGGAQTEGNAVPIPAPDSVPATEEPAPLPLPPPPGSDTQGSLGRVGTDQIAATAATPEQGATAPPGEPDGASASAVLPPPPPDQNSDGAVSVSDPSDAVAPPPSPAKPKPAAKATQAAQKKPAATSRQKSAAGPVVLVPPSQEQTPGQAALPSQAVPPSQASDSVSQPVSQQGAEPPRKRKTLFDLFGGSSDAGSSARPAQPDDEGTRVASLPDPAQPPSRPAARATAPAEPAGRGYVVQLASFRSPSEAQAEYDRLRNRYPDVIGGLPSRVSEATVAGSTRYRLGVGPVASRDEASRICNSLFARGERDCLVRSQ